MSSSGAVQLPPPGSVAGSILVPNLWYPMSFAASVASTGRANGTMDALPFWCGMTHTFQAFGLQVTTAATGTGIAELGIYADNGSGYPGALVVDGGHVVTTAIATPTVAKVFTLPVGLYWVASNFSGATTTPVVTRIANDYSLVTGAITAGGQGGWGGYEVTGVAAGLPNTFPAGGTPALVTLVQVQA